MFQPSVPSSSSAWYLIVSGIISSTSWAINPNWYPFFETCSWTSPSLFTVWNLFPVNCFTVSNALLIVVIFFFLLLSEPVINPPSALTAAEKSDPDVLG